MDNQEVLRLITKNDEGAEKQSKLKPIKENHKIKNGN